MAPWIEPDPGIAHPALTLAERRAMLAADGARLLPGSGVACGGSLAVGACENGYREAVVFADVDLPAGATTAPVDPTLAPPPRFSAAVRVSGAEPLPVAQHAPRVAARGGRVLHRLARGPRGARERLPRRQPQPGPELCAAHPRE